jgi:acyl-CoA thioesterase-2
VGQGEDVFLCPAQAGERHQVYGGQFVAQALAAAQGSVLPGQLAHSLHSYFLQAGDSTQAIEYRVERIRDGRSAATREVRAWQSGTEVFRLMASFSNASKDVPQTQVSMPLVPPPEQVKPVDFGAQAPSWARGLQMRYINLPGDDSGEKHKIRAWLKVEPFIERQLGSAAAVLAFLSDASVGDAMYLERGLWWDDSKVRYFSLDHALWFHRQTNSNEWLLFEQAADWTGSGRGMARTRIYNLAGELVASCAQEALLLES